MSFNPDPSKQTQGVIFSRKINKVYLPPLSFNSSTIQQIFKNIFGYILMKSFHSNIFMKQQINPIRVLELFANSITFFLTPLY